MSTQPTTTTNQETAARGSYISLAASITAKFKCCISSDTNTTTETNTHARNHGVALERPKDPPQDVGEDGEDIPVVVME